MKNIAKLSVIAFAVLTFAACFDKDEKKTPIDTGAAKIDTSVKPAIDTGKTDTTKKDTVKK